MSPIAGGRRYFVNQKITSMPAVFLTTPGTRASLVSERLRIEIPPSNCAQEQLVRHILLIDTEHLVLCETTHITVAPCIP